MTDQEKEKPVVSSGIRAIGEQDRTEEFKARRDQFIVSVDRFLNKVDAVCATDKPELAGVSVQQKPGVWTEIIGKSGPRTNLSMEHVENPGVYYFVDAKNRPTLQIVEKEVVGPEKLVTRIWEVAGSDPLERMSFGPEAGYATAGNMVDLSTIIFRDDQFGQNRTELRVCGDGAVKTTLPATDTAPAMFSTVRDENEMFAAEIILDELSQQFFGETL